uniref:Uncharacterized protein n=1 Tax=Tetranychus urticae TaxID=32264 RepID=T1KTI4_TETUR
MEKDGKEKGRRRKKINSCQHLINCYWNM